MHAAALHQAQYVYTHAETCPAFHIKKQGMQIHAQIKQKMQIHAQIKQKMQIHAQIKQEMQIHAQL